MFRSALDGEKNGMSSAAQEKKKHFLSTVECYDAWSATYDVDGNVLQFLDDLAFEALAETRLNDRLSPGRLCCELGCGTGRNTTKVINAGWRVVSH